MCEYLSGSCTTEVIMVIVQGTIHVFLFFTVLLRYCDHNFFLTHSLVYVVAYVKSLH
jgi:hypothetical protein